MSTRLILVVVIVVVILGGAGAFLFLQSQNNTPANDNNDNVAQQPVNTGTPDTPEPTITPIPMGEVVIAVQDIPRGVVIQPNMLGVFTFPAANIPQRAYSNIEEVVGNIARTDIYRENLILSNQLVTDLGSLGNVGSDAAAILPPGRVAVSLPIDVITSVAYALQPGDNVDVIVSMLFIDIDPEFQSELPNRWRSVDFSTTTDPETGEETLSSSNGPEGIGEFDSRTIPIGFGGGSFEGSTQILTVIIAPDEQQRPRLTTQRTVQDAEVIWVGEFPVDGRIFRPAPSPTPVVTEDPNATEAPADAPPPPTPVPPRPSIITLAVRPQDAVVLTYLAEANLPMTFALRSARDTGLPPTDPVTLDYIMQEFNIAVPDKFNYGVQPAIRSIRSLTLGERIDIGN